MFLFCRSFEKICPGSSLMPRRSSGSALSLSSISSPSLTWGPPCTWPLAKEYQLSRKTLEDKHNWKKLVYQKIPFRKNEITLETVNYMAEILQLMKTPRMPLLRELLHTICERFSINPFPTVLTVPTVERLNIFCPDHEEPHRIIAIRSCSFRFVLWCFWR